VDSIIGSSDNEKRAVFARKLAHIAKWHARAIYGQTGTGRHLNHYSHMLSVEVGALVKRMTKENDVQEKRRAADLCGRGMVNFRKLFSHGVIEFRAFAGTLNWSKLQHHLGTVLGLCRRAHEVQCLGAFEKNKLQASRTQSAVQALEFLWNYLGWNGRNRPVALGLFGELHENAEMHKSKAMEMCRKFDSAFPEAAL
jgi:hypothetical protein